MLRLILLAVSVSVLWSLCSAPIAASSSSLVISHFQTGGAGTGTTNQEFIALYNNLTADIDISNWCIKYSDYNNASSTELYCFEKSEGMDGLLMTPHSSVVIVSPNYPVQDPLSITGSYKSSSAVMSGARGHIILYDHEAHEIDRVAWDNAASTPPVYPEVRAAVAPVGGSMALREIIDGTYSDSDNNYEDFAVVSSQRPIADLLIDYSEPIIESDMCLNIPDIQTTMLDGYDFDDNGNCQPIVDDRCLNIQYIQLTAPDGMISHSDNNCYDQSSDICINLTGFQLSMPEGYRLAAGECRLITIPSNIWITELLPNSNGTDEGNEFIEIHNGENISVNLSDYIFRVGKNAEKEIVLPDVVLLPGTYIAFTDTELGFTLLNTTTRVELLFYNGTLISEVIPYQDPQDDMAWALIEGVWQYTNHPTANQANIASSEVLGDGTEDVSELSPCPAGKYRNPLTNRCRNILDDANALVTCDADEYRSPDTNRCRKLTLASVSLAPCDDGYERNPATNRCRKLVNESELAPCDEGYERNPETNRCKKSLAKPLAASVANDSSSPKQDMTTLLTPYTIAATASIGAVGYGIYEWRTELGLVIRRILGVIIRK